MYSLSKFENYELIFFSRFSHIVHTGLACFETHFIENKTLTHLGNVNVSFFCCCYFTIINLLVNVLFTCADFY